MPLGSWPASEEEQVHKIVHACGPDNSFTTASGRFSLATTGPEGEPSAKGVIYFIGNSDPNGGAPVYLHTEEFELFLDTRKVWGCPNNTDQITVQLFSAKQEVGWNLDLQPK